LRKSVYRAFFPCYADYANVNPPRQESPHEQPQDENAVRGGPVGTAAAVRPGTDFAPAEFSGDDHMDSDNSDNSTLKRNGLKNTRHRGDVLKILEQNTQPVTAERVFLALKKSCVNISLSTVYRILEVLVAKDIVLKLSTAENESAMFELNRKVHRHYLICLGCHKMLPVEGCPLGGLEARLERETGFTVTGHRLEIYGYCAECRKKQAKRDVH
jgi:Fur family transcriptional regulator, ferric uptake regulator